MTLTTLLNRPCTLVRRSLSSTRDDYGNQLTVTSNVSTVCELQRSASRAAAEPDAQGEMSDTTWLLVLPAGTAIGTDDAVIVDGLTYEMFGDPWHARNPRTGAESHVECTLRRTAGAGDTT